MVTKLMMEELVWLLDVGEVRYEDVNIFEGVPGFMASYVEAVHSRSMPDLSNPQKYMLCDESGLWGSEEAEEEYDMEEESEPLPSGQGWS